MNFYSEKKKEVIKLIAILSIILFYSDVLLLVNKGTFNKTRVVMFLSILYFLFINGTSQEIIDKHTFRTNTVIASLYVITVFSFTYLLSLDICLYFTGVLPAMYLAILYLITNIIYSEKKSEIRMISYGGRSITYKDKNPLIPVDLLNVKISFIAFIAPPALLILAYLIWIRQ